MMENVKLVDLTRHLDDRGYLYEVIHKSDDFVSGRDAEIRQVYIVGDPARGAIRAYHRHDYLHDWFCVVHGTAKFVLFYVAPEDEPAFQKGDTSKIQGLRTFTLSALKPQVLVVPPPVYHGWVALEDDTVLLSSASHEYNREKPDEYRVPHDLAGDVWRMTPR